MRRSWPEVDRRVRARVERRTQVELVHRRAAGLDYTLQAELVHMQAAELVRTQAVDRTSTVVHTSVAARTSAAVHRRAADAEEVHHTPVERDKMGLNRSNPCFLQLRTVAAAEEEEQLHIPAECTSWERVARRPVVGGIAGYSCCTT